MMLKLSTLKVQGEPVEIDGTAYYTVPPGWWSEEHSLAVRPHLNYCRNYEKRRDDNDESLSTEDAREYRHHLAQVAHVILPDCPQSTINALPEGDLAGFVQGFFLVVGEWQRGRRMAMLQKNGNGKTPPESSPGSPASIPASVAGMPS